MDTGFRPHLSGVFPVSRATFVVPAFLISIGAAASISCLSLGPVPFSIALRAVDATLIALLSPSFDLGTVAGLSQMSLHLGIVPLPLRSQLKPFAHLAERLSARLSWVSF